MKLDRNTNDDGKGKYALVRLREIERGSEARKLLDRLHELGHLDWGRTGEEDEFFVIKLRDSYAYEAIAEYALGVLNDADRRADCIVPGSETPAGSIRRTERADISGLVEYGLEIMALAYRAGRFSRFCKEPD